MRGAQVTCETYDVQQASPGIATISFEQQKIQIPLDFEDAKNKLIYEAVRSLQRRVDHLEKELKNQKLLAEIHVEREISDANAKAEIIDYLKQQKTKMIHHINILNLVTTLNLPADQIERIMDSLGKIGAVKENGTDS